jgi:hypothetical protein
MAGEGADRAVRPLVLFGAFDRHNFGDLLFPHVAQALLPGRELHFAGLAQRDLRGFGGHAVTALPALATALAGRPATVLHVGGEILTCSAWQAAAMLLPPDESRDTIAFLEARPAQRRAWVRRTLGLPSRAPYLAPPSLFAPGSRFAYAGVGGVALDACPAAMRTEVLARLAAAHHLSVRDARTQAQLATAGLAARLVPDPAAAVAVLFGERIRAAGDAPAPAAVRQRFPRGHLAVQLAAEFGDDRTLAQLASQLGALAEATGFGIALFRAGAAPWHDDLEGLRRLAARLPAGKATVFESLQLWEICALLAGSRGYCGSSLHGRIVATAFGLPRLGLERAGRAGGAGKQAAYAATWEDTGLPGVAPVDDFADALLAALASPPARLAHAARRLADAALDGFAAMRGALAI